MNSKILKNIFSYSMGNLISKAMLFLFNVIVARYYGSEIFGKYNYAVSVVTYFIMLANLGIQSYSVYNVAKRVDDAEKIFREVVSAEVLLGTISSLLLVVFVLIVPINRSMVLLVGITILISSIDISWLFQALQETQYVALQLLINSLLSFFLIGLLIIGGVKAYYGLPLIVAISQLISYTVTWKSLRKKLHMKFRFTLENLLENIKNGLPFLFSGIFAAINCNIDILLLTVMTNNHIVGVYSAIYKIVNLIIMIVSFIVAPVFPQMISLYTKGDIISLENIICKLWSSLAIIIFPIVIGGFITGEKLIVYMYGNDYSGGGITFSILLLYCFVFYFRERYGYTLTMIGKQSLYMRIVLISCIFNFAFNVILIFKINIVGAAIATLISELINYTLMRYFANKYCHMKIKIKVFKVIFNTVIMGIVTFLLYKRGVNVILNICISMMIYAILFLLTNITKIKNKNIREDIN